VVKVFSLSQHLQPTFDHIMAEAAEEKPVKRLVKSKVLLLPTKLTIYFVESSRLSALTASPGRHVIDRGLADDNSTARFPNTNQTRHW